MEDIMDAGFRREAQTICHSTQSLGDLKRPKVTRPNLGGGSRSDANSRALVETQPNPVTDQVFDGTRLPVLMLSHDILGQQQSITNIFQERVTVVELPVHSRHSGCAGCVGQHGRRGTAVGNLKRSSTEGGLERDVEAVFRPQ
jgi:hypothetical protein